jgi:hypothetical protein
MSDTIIGGSGRNQAGSVYQVWFFQNYDLIIKWLRARPASGKNTD